MPRLPAIAGRARAARGILVVEAVRRNRRPAYGVRIAELKRCDK